MGMNMCGKLNNILLTFLLGLSFVLAQGVTQSSLAETQVEQKREPIRVNPPNYPRAAERRGIEGYVILEYTVLADGKVEDVIVVDATPEGVFDKAALNAVQKWLYKEGPTTTPGMKVRLTFSHIND